MLDDAVCNVDNARFLLRVINNLRHQAFFAFRLDRGCAIGEGLLDERNDVGLGQESSTTFDSGSAGLTAASFFIVS
jgi:hypothetical protein